jgi:two-component system NtrC family response regulator
MNTKVLVVESDSVMRKKLQEELRKNGLDVEVAQHGQAALLLMDQEGFEPDIVITGISMAPFGGIVLAGKLQDRGFQTHRIIFTYGKNDGVEHDKLIGFSPYLVEKPSFDGLLQTIERSLAESPQMSECLT